MTKQGESLSPKATPQNNKTCPNVQENPVNRDTQVEELIMNTPGFK